ncbi:MAG: glycoside hydrolase family 5 protein [Pirellulales bacterium]
MERRDFLKTTALATAGLLGGAPRVEGRESENKPAAEVDYRHLPRWRGFNLLEKFTLGQNAPYRESDFAWMKTWGFDFVRLPMDYRCWTDPDDPNRLKEDVLAHIDQAVNWGKQYGIHVNLNLHRAPGYCVNPPREKLDLWTSDEAQKQFDAQWARFAKRYKGIPNARVSFDLVNEPSQIPTDAYVKAMTGATEAIRREDPARLVIVDGLRWGMSPVHELVGLKVAQSTRGYQPTQISHYRANWMQGSDQWPEPTWPLREGGEVRDRQWLYKDRIVPWKALEAKGVGIHVGEWGAYNRTPHAVALAWMGDFLSLWREAGWGWSLWNLRGAFGPIDSGRGDVSYEKFEGHLVDRKMLELLRQG